MWERQVASVVVSSWRMIKKGGRVSCRYPPVLQASDEPIAFLELPIVITHAEVISFASQHTRLLSFTHCLSNCSPCAIFPIAKLTPSRTAMPIHSHQDLLRGWFIRRACLLHLLTIPLPSMSLPHPPPLLPACHPSSKRGVRLHHARSGGGRR